MGDEQRGRREGRRVLRTDSDRLLEAVEELRALEREKRQLDVSSKPFHDLAQRVEAKAREVFRLAGQESDDGAVTDALGDAGGPIEESIDETAPFGGRSSTEDSPT